MYFSVCILYIHTKRQKKQSIVILKKKEENKKESFYIVVANKCRTELVNHHFSLSLYIIQYNDWSRRELLIDNKLSKGICEPSQSGSAAEH